MQALRIRWTGRLLVCAVALGLLAGLESCQTPIGVRKRSFEEVYQRLTENAVSGPTPSASAELALTTYDLRDEFRSEPYETLAKLKAKALEERRRWLLFALSELSYVTAKRNGNSDDYLATAVYAYLFLFSVEDSDPPSPYDPRFRLACDLYNRGLARALLAEDRKSVVLADQECETPAGRITIRSERPGFPWGPEQFNHFLAADSFLVRGLSSRARTHGLGVPLICLPNDEEGVEPAGFMSSRAKLPATAFLRIEGGLDALESGTMDARLELHSTFDARAVKVNGIDVPLESDLTASVAHTLESAKLWDLALTGFFSGQDEMPTGVYLQQPYESGKIPVVFVHGTASQPAWWAEMFNGLVQDSVLRSRYQAWFFVYNSGNPIVYSASLLRESLEDVVTKLDPGGVDAALQQMVIVGHSQGGLLTRMTVSPSGDALWANVTDQPLEDLDLEPEAERLLESCFFFESLPFVRRVVFISTPHRGSYVAGNWIGRLFAKMVSLPEDIRSAARGLFRRGVLPADIAERIPTSVDNMDPSNPFVQTLAEIPIDEGVGVHSIVAVRGSGEITEGNDGVVEYPSAHLDEAESEFIVRSGHSCQGHPLVIGEVRRILLEHLAQVEAAAGEGAAQP